MEGAWQCPEPGPLTGQNGKPLYLASQYSETLMVFQMNSQKEMGKATYVIKLHPLDAWAQLTWKDGRMEKKEFYYGTAICPNPPEHWYLMIRWNPWLLRIFRETSGRFIGKICKIINFKKIWTIR